MLTTSPRPVVAFDPLDQAWRFEDRPLYQRLREAGGIAWSPEHGGFWAIVDQELGRQVTADHTSFVSGRGVRIPPSPTFPVFALEYDRPRHVVHRKMLTDAVGPRAVPPLEPMVREHARRLLASAAGRAIDLGEDYGFRLPIDVVFDVIGAPEELKDDVEEIAGALFIYRTPLADGRDAGARMAEIVGEMVAARTAEPRGDWLSMVVAQGHDAENPLDEREVHGAILALLLGGHHSTVRVTSSLMAYLVSHDELQEKLRAHPERIPAAVEEAVRLFIPLGWFARTATEDVRVGEVTVAAGERVMVLYAGTNLDPARYDSPEVFDTGRPRPGAHLGFGWGIHRCVGMPLAQLELRVAVEELLAASPWVRLREPTTWTSSSEPRHIPCTLGG